MKMSKQELAEWNELYQYIKKEVLIGYNNKNLPKKLVLRLKGLREGKIMADKKHEIKADYPYPEILLAFKIYKFDIQVALKNIVFDNESKMSLYIMAIIEDKINDVMSMIERKKKSEEKTEKLDLENQIVDKAEYQSKTKEVKNERLKDLW